MSSGDYQRALDDVALIFERTRDQWMSVEGTDEWDPWKAHAYGEGARVLRAWADDPWRMEKVLAAARSALECNGICVTAGDIGFPEVGGMYAAHPDCPKHGHLATHNVDGSPR